VIGFETDRDARGQQSTGVALYYTAGFHGWLIVSNDFAVPASGIGGASVSKRLIGKVDFRPHDVRSVRGEQELPVSGVVEGETAGLPVFTSQLRAGVA
jgi:hypothetical protein